MARNVHVELILMFLIALYAERITANRFYRNRYHPGSFSSEESMEMSSESREGGYYGPFRRTSPYRHDYELFADYVIVSEDSVRPLDHFGGHPRFGRGMRVFGTFAGKKYFIIQDNRGLYGGSAVSLDGVLVSENRLQKLYGFGKALRRLPLLYVGQRGYEEVFLIGKLDLDALTGGLASATIATNPTKTTTGSAPRRTTTAPSRDGGIPGRNAARSRFSRE